MTESCKVIVKNDSGRPLDAVVMWHFATEPETDDLPPRLAFLKAANVPVGQIIAGTTSLTWGSPTDYWVCGVLFHGDGKTYSLSGMTGEPWKEYEVSNGSTITFIINPYRTDASNQADVTIQYKEDRRESAPLIHAANAAIADVGNAIAHVVGELAETAG